MICTETDPGEILPQSALSPLQEQLEEK